MRTIIKIVLEDEQDVFGTLSDHVEAGISEDEIKDKIIEQVKEQKIAEMMASSFNQMLASVVHVDEKLKQKVYVSSVDCYSNNDNNSLLDSWKVGIANEN